MTIEFVKWPDTSNFKGVLSNIKYFGEINLYYRGKIKLHGTNAAISVKNRNVAVQSRSSIITTKADNMGFARFVESLNLEDSLKIIDEKQVTFFGEWCGKGIQKGVAVSEVDKFFAIFAVQVEDTLCVEPSYIYDYWKHYFTDLPENVKIIPWGTIPYRVDSTSPESLHSFVEKCNKHIDEINDCDPWIKEEFGIEGVGEGLVFYPLESLCTQFVNKDFFKRKFFKAKGEKHAAIKQNRPVVIDPEVVKSIQECVDLVATVPRFQQAVMETNSEDFLTKNIGPFLKWVMSDIDKDFKNKQFEIPENVEMKQVKKFAQNKARDWYLNSV